MGPESLIEGQYIFLHGTSGVGNAMGGGGYAISVRKGIPTPHRASPARAMAQTSTPVAPLARSNRAHSLTVLAVLTTSSNNATRAPGSGARSAKAWSTLGWRWPARSLVCGKVSRMRRRPSGHSTIWQRCAAAREFQRLVEATLPQAVGMQGDREDAIWPGSAPFSQGSGEQVPQQARMGQTAAEFQAFNEEIQRRLVTKRDKGAVKSGRAGLTACTQRAPPRRQWFGAAWAGRVIARQVAGARRAQIASACACRTAQKAKRWQKQRLERAPALQHHPRNP